jgi:hypothetical protein
MAYADLLKDPRWQKKRLEVMARDGFECSNCGTETKTLHVHHGYYEKGKMPWEYPDETLYCLCEKCHREVSCDRTKLERAIGLLHPSQYDMVRGFALSMIADDECNVNENPLIHIDSWMTARGACYFWGIRGRYAAEAVINACDDKMNVFVATLVGLSQDVQSDDPGIPRETRDDNAHP